MNSPWLSAGNADPNGSSCIHGTGNAQAFEYGTQESGKFHTHARNSIESLNQQIKSGGTEDIESASRRHVRGFGATQIIVTILLTSFNLRKIPAFISDKIKEDAKKQVNG